nr:hypothetical protein [Pararhizobium sp. IMCC21322]
MPPDQVVDSITIDLPDLGGGIFILIAGVSAQAFPRQTFGIEVVQIGVGGIGPPLVWVKRHPLLQRLQAMVGS